MPVRHRKSPDIMQIRTLLPVVLMALTASAYPKHLRHYEAHQKQELVEKRDVVLMTELVVYTEVMSTTVTIFIGPSETPMTIIPPSVNTSPRTRTINGPTITEVSPSPARAYLNEEAPTTSQTSTTTAVPQISLPQAVQQPPMQVTQPSVTQSSVSQPRVQQPSPTTVSSYVAPVVPPSSPNQAQPSSPPVPSLVATSLTATSSASVPAATSPSIGDAAGVLYGLVLPPGQQDRTSRCTGSTCSGMATWYNGLTDQMSCGYNGMQGQDDVKRIAALPYQIMGPSSNSNSATVWNKPTNGNCGRMISVSCPSTGQSTTVVVVDKCGGCPSETSLDLSPAAFAALGVNPDKGKVEITWSFMS